MTAERIGWSSAAAALAVAAIWGGNVVALKIGLATFPPFWSAFWRMLVGAAVVGGWALATGIPLRPGPGEHSRLAALGLLFTVQITALNNGVDMTSPAYGVVLLNAHPIFANLLGHFFVPGDRLSWQRILGLAISFAGISAVFLGRPEAELARNPAWGNLVVILSAFLLGSRLVYTQRLVQRIDPLRALFWQMAFSLPLFLAAAGVWEQALLKPVSREAIGAILYQGALIAGFCFVVWTRLLKRHSPGMLSMFAFATPIFGVMISAAIYGEQITPRLLAGMAAVTAGIVIVTGWAQQPEPAARESDAAGNAR